MDPTVLLAALLVIIALVIYIWPRRTSGMPPGPLQLPLIGNLLQFSEDTFHEDLERLGHKYGPIFSIAMGKT